MSEVGKPSPHILVVRLGAMGDIIHTLPAVAALKQAFPGCHLTWMVESKWMPLLDSNPCVDHAIALQRDSLPGLIASWKVLTADRYDFAVDFQGLLKSALVTFFARPEKTFGFDASGVRERAAAVFYTERVHATAVHVVDRNLELANRVTGLASSPPTFPIGPGRAEGNLPTGSFILASPLAGWASKQWPLEHYQSLANQLAIPLVLNLPAGAQLPVAAPAVAHYSGIPGLIDATRRATAVIGVDSGPLHLAAALSKPGVAIFGPTDPSRNGPYGGSLQILRSRTATTTYKRNNSIDPAMQAISPHEVLETLARQLPDGCLRV